MTTPFEMHLLSFVNVVPWTNILLTRIKLDNIGIFWRKILNFEISPNFTWSWPILGWKLTTDVTIEFCLPNDACSMSHAHSYNIIIRGSHFTWPWPWHLDSKKSILIWYFLYPFRNISANLGFMAKIEDFDPSPDFDLSFDSLYILVH